MILDEFRNILQNNGHLVTSERLRLFDELRSRSEPVNISTLCNKTQDIMNQTTVYRNIELFEKLKIITRVYHGWKYKIELSDKFRTHHHHFSCLICSSVIEIDEPKSLAKTLSLLENQYGFVIKSHAFELTGYCKNCRK